MAVAGSVFLSLFLASIANHANAFVAPSLTRASVVRGAPSTSSNVAARLSRGAYLVGSTFAPPLSCVGGMAVDNSQQRASRAATSMSVINVGVIGAGRCVSNYVLWYFVLVFCCTLRHYSSILIMACSAVNMWQHYYHTCNTRSCCCTVPLSIQSVGTLIPCSSTSSGSLHALCMWNGMTHRNLVSIVAGMPGRT